MVATFSELPPAIFWILLSNFIYILHQIEEHSGDRFRSFINNMVLPGKQPLTPHAVMVINVGLVWALMGTCLLAARYISPAFAVVALCLCWINALAHIVQALATREYNPGLITATALLLPSGLYGNFSLSAHISWPLQIGAIVLVILVHIGIAYHVARSVSELKA